MISTRWSLKKSGISINEDLTKSKLNLLKKAVEHAAVEQAWSTDGRIITLLKATNGNKVTKLIATEQDLENLPSSSNDTWNITFLILTLHIMDI